MKTYFYAHIVSFEPIHTHLEKTHIKDSEREELIRIIESSIHYSIMHELLKELEDAKAKLLVDHIAQEKHDDAWALVESTIENAESLISETAKTLFAQLEEDILSLNT